MSECIRDEALSRVPPKSGRSPGKGISRTFETRERIEEAATDYLKRHGVKRVGHREVFVVEETDKGVQICGRSAMRYYFDDKEPEEPPSSGTCVDVPKEFLAQVRAVLEKCEE